MAAFWLIFGHIYTAHAMMRRC